MKTQKGLEFVRKMVKDAETEKNSGCVNWGYNYLLKHLRGKILVDEAEICAKKDKEFSLLQFGQLSETSKEVARVLVIRYKEILGEE